MQSINDRLENLRRVKNLTWEGLAAGLELSVSMLMQVKRGGRKLSDKSLYRLEQLEAEAGIAQSRTDSIAQNRTIMRDDPPPYNFTQDWSAMSDETLGTLLKNTFNDLDRSDDAGRPRLLATISALARELATRAGKHVSSKRPGQPQRTGAGDKVREIFERSPAQSSGKPTP